MDLNRFTQKAQEAVIAAQKLASAGHHSQIDPEHLLLALSEQEGGVVPEVLERIGVRPSTLTAQLKEMLASRKIDCKTKILKVHGQEKDKVILKYIKEAKPDLVIIRIHKEFTTRPKKLGKFVTGIIHGTDVPVFTVGNTKPHRSH